MATLKSLVDETSNIKNELDECHTNLKTNLVAKGVECSATDKMLNLINKINYIQQSYNVVAGNDVILYKFSDNSHNIYQKTYTYNIFCSVNGSFRFNYKGYSTQPSNPAICEASIIRNGIIINKIKKELLNTSFVNISQDIDEVKYGDIFNIKLYQASTKHGGEFVLNNISCTKVV